MKGSRTDHPFSRSNSQYAKLKSASRAKGDSSRGQNDAAGLVRHCDAPAVPENSYTAEPLDLGFGSKSRAQQADLSPSLILIAALLVALAARLAGSAQICDTVDEKIQCGAQQLAHLHAAAVDAVAERVAWAIGPRWTKIVSRNAPWLAVAARSPITVWGAYALLALALAVKLNLRVRVKRTRQARASGCYWRRWLEQQYSR